MLPLSEVYSCTAASSFPLVMAVCSCFSCLLTPMSSMMLPTADLNLFSIFELDPKTKSTKALCNQFNSSFSIGASTRFVYYVSCYYPERITSGLPKGRALCHGVMVSIFKADETSSHFSLKKNVFPSKAIRDREEDLLQEHIILCSLRL